MERRGWGVGDAYRWELRITLVEFKMSNMPRQGVSSAYYFKFHFSRGLSFVQEMLIYLYLFLWYVIRLAAPLGAQAFASCAPISGPLPLSANKCAVDLDQSEHVMHASLT